MIYTSEDFKGGRCPECGSQDIEEEGNIANAGFFNGAGYFLNLPFGPDYRCRNCGARASDCFVAATVYGDENASQVQTLREFRDNVLSKSDLGKAFINFYYSGAGKKTADFIKKHLPSSIPVIRKGLDTLVERYSAMREK